MKRLNLTQGTPEWHAHRATARNASEAPAVLGCSPYTTRSQLLQARHTGLRHEADPAQQRRFDDGHAIEAAQLPGAAQLIGEPLYPVTGVEDVDGLELSASFDGLTMAEDVVYECKTLNDDLRAVLPYESDMANEGNGRDLPKHYRVQMEQQLMVSGADTVLFVAATKDGTDVRRCWYFSDPALRAEIIAGWRQFDADLAAYTPTEPAAPAAVAAPVEALPAVSVRMDGALAVHSNLDVFGAKLREFIAKIPAKPTSDQEFVDCDAACKALKKAEDALDGAEASALGQVQSVETLTRTIADLRNVARTARLAAEKVVKVRKEQIRLEEVQRGQKALAEFVAGLNATIGRPYMPALAHDFPGCISGKKTLESLRAAVDQHLADKKIEANAISNRIVANLRTLREQADGYQGLFPDTAMLVLKAEDDCRAVITSRITEHKAAEEKRLEAERERIRAEEAAKLQAEQRRREEAEAASRITEGLAEARRTDSLPADLIDAVASATSALITDMALSRAAAPNVVQMQRPTTPPAAMPASLILGTICQRLGFTVTAEFVKSLGIEPAANDRNAKKYTEAQFVQLCDALVSHIGAVSQQQQAA